MRHRFNSQPREGGWLTLRESGFLIRVSTHSRAKAAGLSRQPLPAAPALCFNSQPREGGWKQDVAPSYGVSSVSTHSRPKAAGAVGTVRDMSKAFQLTAARRRLVKEANFIKILEWFQLTAARRRLAVACYTLDDVAKVSTHSRPKAAGQKLN